MKKHAAEFAGTFFLVLCGTGAIIVNEQYNGALGTLGVPIAFGGIVTAMIYLFGRTSGAHLNPAVTLGFAALKLFPAKEILPYLLAQVIGAFTASGMLWLFFPTNPNLGSTQPAGSELQSFLLEYLLTLILMLVILIVSQGSPKIRQYAAITIGMVILLEAYWAGPICGASMNPARSLAPALVSGQLESLWLYLLAPIVGSLSASLIYKIFRC